MERIQSKTKLVISPFVSAFAQFLFLCTIFLGALYLIDSEPTYGNHYDFVNFERTVSYSQSPPIESKDWKPAFLPERLSKEFIEDNFPADKKWTSLWYRRSFDGVDLQDFSKAEHKSWAIYIIEPFANVAVYLNGSFIGESGKMKPPIPYFRTPVMFTFPRELIKPTGNTLYYQVAFGTRNSWPNHLSIGPSKLFEEKYANRILLKKTIPFAILIMMAVLTVFMLLIFYLRPQEKVYGWYALATFVWMIHHGMKLINHIPFNNKMLWHAFSYWTLGLFVAFGTQYIANFSNIRHTKINRAIFWWAVLAGAINPVVATLSPDSTHTFGKYIWVPCVLLVGLYAVSILVLSFKRKPNAENKHLLLAISILTTVGIRDYLFDFTDLVPGTNYYIQYAAGFVIIYWADRKSVV